MGGVGYRRSALRAEAALGLAGEFRRHDALYLQCQGRQMLRQSREQFFLLTVGCKLADQRAFLRVAAELFEMGLHVFHEPVLVKPARGVSSKVNPRFQKNLENYPGVRRSVRAKEGQSDRYPRTAGGPRTIATFRAAPSSRSASARAFASAGASRSRRFWRCWRASCRCSISTWSTRPRSCRKHRSPSARWAGCR
jgi:hypothetical protein